MCEWTRLCQNPVMNTQNLPPWEQSRIYGIAEDWNFRLIYPKFDMSDEISMKFEHPDKKWGRYIRSPTYRCPFHPRFTVFQFRMGTALTFIQWSGPRWVLETDLSYDIRCWNRQPRRRPHNIVKKCCFSISFLHASKNIGHWYRLSLF